MLVCYFHKPSCFWEHASIFSGWAKDEHILIVLFIVMQPVYFPSQASCPPPVFQRRGIHSIKLVYGSRAWDPEVYSCLKSDLGPNQKVWQQIKFPYPCTRRGTPPASTILWTFGERTTLFLSFLSSDFQLVWGRPTSLQSEVERFVLSWLWCFQHEGVKTSTMFFTWHDLDQTFPRPSCQTNKKGISLTGDQKKLFGDEVTELHSAVMNLKIMNRNDFKNCG